MGFLKRSQIYQEPNIKGSDEFLCVFFFCVAKTCEINKEREKPEDGGRMWVWDFKGHFPVLNEGQNGGKEGINQERKGRSLTETKVKWIILIKTGLRS
ncbi:Uncharacterized protein TCM_015347 [Theobroma cacao]|uniref:Uncharacterized protein n=1 Tax=Theobroma cacao TaxID=3641 RepID=A0A061G234_THECC|nr:Uncharacterized protein TCM_015347 [Theobroma cacao]